MGILSGALPRDQQPQQQQQPTVKSREGIYRALFLGMSDPFEYVSPWANDKCRLCKGTGLGKNNEGECFVCHGSKRKTEQHVKLVFRLENGVIEEEEMNFKLSAPGMGQNNQPLSPSTLFVRLRTLSGLANATEAQLDEWYSGLQKPIKIPCQLVIAPNKTATMLKITSVVSAQMGSAPAPAGEANREASDDEYPPFDDNDFAGYERR